MPNEVDYDQIGSLLLRYWSFKQAESGIAWLKRMVTQHRYHPGRALDGLLRMHVRFTGDEHSVVQLRQEPFVREVIGQWQERDPPDLTPGVSPPKRLPRALFSRTDRYNIAVAGCVREDGSNLPLIQLLSTGNPPRYYTRNQAHDLIEALQTGINLLDRLGE